MAPEIVEPSLFTPDVVELIGHLHNHRVEYMIVGGEAAIYYGHIRLTGDIDFFYNLSSENSKRLFSALREFWSDEIPTLERPAKLEEIGAIFQFGIPPNRIDFLNKIDGVDFPTAWQNREIATLNTHPQSIPLNYIGLADLIKKKQSAARPKDLDDVIFLTQAQESKGPR